MKMQAYSRSVSTATPRVSNLNPKKVGGNNLNVVTAELGSLPEDGQHEEEAGAKEVPVQQQQPPPHVSGSGNGSVNDSRMNKKPLGRGSSGSSNEKPPTRPAPILTEQQQKSSMTLPSTTPKSTVAVDEGRNNIDNHFHFDTETAARAGATGTDGKKSSAGNDGGSSKGSKRSFGLR